VSMFSATQGIMCYRDVSNSFYGRGSDSGNSTCNALVVSGTTLTKGADLVVNTANTSDISVSMFSATQGIMCYRDVSNRDYGTCNALVVSGTTLTKGANLVVNSGYTHDISLSLVDNEYSATQGIMCYRAYNLGYYNNGYPGICNALVVSGTTLIKGADLLVDDIGSISDQFSVSMFSATQGIMCYRDNSNSGYGTCNALVLSGTTLIKGADLVVNSGNTHHISVSMNSATQGIMCYTDESNSGYGKCNVLRLSTGRGPSTFSCQAIKNAYSAQQCCTNPNAIFTLPAAAGARRAEGPKANSEDVVSKMETLGKLHKQGFLTDEEFQAQRVRLLDEQLR